MDIGKTPVLVAMKRRLSWLGQRQKVLAQNIANADTPNYKPRDLKALKFADLVGSKQKSVSMATTSPGHISGRADGGPNVSEVSRSYETAPAGNAVILEEQALKVSKTAVDHQLIIQLYKKQLRIYATAIGK